MSAISPEESVLRVAAADHEPVTLHLDAARPTAVRIDVQGTCTCQGSASGRPGSYTDTDFGRR